MVIDVTDPEPRSKSPTFPVPGRGPIADQSACASARDLPKWGSGTRLHDAQRPGQQRGGLSRSGTSPMSRNPLLVGAMRGLRNTHKHWWECKTGIAYLPGSLGPSRCSAMASRTVDARSSTGRIRRSPFLPPHASGWSGPQPSATGPGPAVAAWRDLSARASERGAASLRVAPPPATSSATGSTLAWGVGDDGVMQVLDRQKTLPPPFGTFTGNPNDPDQPAVGSNAGFESSTCRPTRAATRACRCSGWCHRAMRTSPSSRPATS